MTETFKTGISQAYWCSISSSNVDFVPARIALTEEGPRSRIAWLDELLEGGLHLPEKGGRPLVLLVSGPPGSGKTTFAVELCYRLARNDDRLNPDELFTLYISTDQPADQVVANARSFGYPQAEKYVVDFEPDKRRADKFDRGRVAVWGRDRIEQETELLKKSEAAGVVAALVDAALGALSALLTRQIQLNVNSRPFIERLLTGSPKRADTKEISKCMPDIVVIDSLNIVVPDLRKEFFERFRSSISTGCRMIVFVLDSGSEHHQHEIWEYASDLVIHLDATSVNDYYIRTIQVIKARYQSHVWGKHQLKIYKKPTLPGLESPNRAEILRRQHPYRNEGGIFIYPSIHYYLSTYKRRGPSGQVSFAQTRPPLTGVLDDGFPEGRCTAFIGSRGGHKSHFAYVHLLHRIINCHQDDQEEAALVISLRDDERMTLRTMQRIKDAEFPSSALTPAGLESCDRLEILYYHPGYITPEEFFNRMFISIHRLKQGRKRKLTVMFNSLDQLSSRFPLCAKLEIFVPAMIETLCGEGATSIFIAVDEPGQPAEQYGLLPMADLILSFYPYRFSCPAYFQHLDEERSLMHQTGEYRARIDEWQSKFSTPQTGTNAEVEAVVIQVVRFAGGQKAGAKGILELVHQPDLGLYKGPGLHFTQLSPKFDQGLRLLTGREHD